ncbi:MAG: radical SAM protein [Bacteroidetes bacterium]|nr:radical SAM protein [Bacteroidota bacterium]
MISVAEIQPLSEVNGPGNRAVIWVQGCSKRCAGCWNPEYLPFNDRRMLTSQDLFQEVRRLTRGFRNIEGVTFSGGEPFAQADSLYPAAQAFKDEGLSLMAFSGYTIEEIGDLSVSAARILGLLDILVDGEYKQDEPYMGLWRSSANQKIHFLSDRYQSWKNEISDTKQEFEVTIDSSNMRLTGFPEHDLLRNLKTTKRQP